MPDLEKLGFNFINRKSNKNKTLCCFPSCKPSSSNAPIEDQDYFTSETAFRACLCSHGLGDLDELGQQAKAHLESLKNFEMESKLERWIRLSIAANLKEQEGSKLSKNVLLFQKPFPLLEKLGFKWDYKGYSFPIVKENDDIWKSNEEGLRVEWHEADFFTKLSRFGFPEQCRFDEISTDERHPLELFLSLHLRDWISCTELGARGSTTFVGHTTDLVDRHFTMSSKRRRIAEESPNGASRRGHEASQPAVVPSAADAGAGESPNRASRRGNEVSNQPAVVPSAADTGAGESPNRASRRGNEVSNQPAVVPSAADAGTGATQVELLSPANWKQIPELIFVKMQKDNVEEVAEAMGDLRSLMAADNENSDKNTKEASPLGAQSLVIATMRKFQCNEDVQKDGCGCLQNLAFGVITRGTAIVKAGGMEAAMNALKIFPDSEALACFGIGMLVNVFSLDLQPAIFQEASNHFVNNFDGPALAIAAMKKFPDNAELQGSCCGLFWVIGKKEEFHGPLKAAGAVSAVGAAFDKFSENEDVKECAKGFMTLMMRQAR